MSGRVGPGMISSDEGSVVPATVPAASTPHSALTFLDQDDHTQYVLRSILTTNGDLFTRSGGVIARLAPVALGSILLSQGATTPPAWSAQLTNGQLLVGSTGVAPVPAQLTAGSGITIVPGAGSITISSTSGTPRGYRFGGTISNNAGDATNDLDFAAGEWASDDAATADRVLLSTTALTKQLDAVWAAGTNAGMRVGALANGTWHLYAFRPAAGDDDIMAEQSTTPTLPSGTKKRYIGSWLREGGVLVPIVQGGPGNCRFDRKVPINSYNQANPLTAAITVTSHVPTGRSFEAIMGWTLNSGAGGGSIGLVTALDTTDTGPAAGVNNIRNGTSASVAGEVRVRTNTSAQFRARLDFSDANTVLQFTTIGWVADLGDTV